MKKRNVKLSDEDLMFLQSLENSSKEKIKISNKHKRKMNRIFREKIGSENIPFPEVDSLFKRFKSGMIRIVNKFKNQ